MCKYKENCGFFKFLSERDFCTGNPKTPKLQPEDDCLINSDNCMRVLTLKHPEKLNDSAIKGVELTKFGPDTSPELEIVFPPTDTGRPIVGSGHT